MQKQSNSYYLEGITKGDNKVLLDIYNEFLPLVKRFVLREKGSASDAEDVFNQVLMQFFVRLKKGDLEINSTFEGYLFTACKNIWRRELNKKSKNRVTNTSYSELNNDNADVARSILEQEKWDLFEEKFQQLSENCKEILRLHLDKVSGRQIMERLGYGSESTVRQRIFKCKSSLVKQIRTDRRYRA